MALFIDNAAELRLFVPNAPIPLAAFAYKKAVIELCKKARAYRHTVDRFPLIATVSEYTLDLPTNTFIQRIEAVEANEYPLLPTSPELLNNEDPNWRTKTAQKPTHYYLKGLDTVKIVYTPSATITDTLHVEVSLVPKQNATEIPDEVAERYYDILLHGATGYLSQLPDESVNNPQRAATSLMLFREGIETAEMEAKRENTAKDKVAAYGGI